MATPINLIMGLREWALLLSLSVLWGGSFFFVGVAVTDLPPLTIVTLRVSLAALGLWLVVALLRYPLPRTPAIWLAFAVMGLINNVIPFSLIVWGQTQIASGLASILNATTPLFTVVVATLVLPDEKATPLKLLGVLVGFAGVVALIGVPAATGAAPLLPQLAILGATLSYAFAKSFGRRFSGMGVPALVIATGQVTASALIMLPMAWVMEGTDALIAASLASWSAVICLALLSTSLAYVLYFMLLERAGATNVSLVTLLVPVFAMALGVMFLDETVTPLQLGGLALIAVGLSAIDGRLWTKAGPPGTGRLSSKARRS
ncbi:DMT family transporter [Marinobacter salinisoli]|uniref:DMT family transporter n=1 Tax=Marinobacter salinisoli TaxID=2769486 RepID=A0ABX7MT11_9GAMM|nr:DMT family transporter [Marinobacter salinisoli]QSP95530.1 DMT family transporter [Marinobacter salinisoli]